MLLRATYRSDVGSNKRPGRPPLLAVSSMSQLVFQQKLRTPVQSRKLSVLSFIKHWQINSRSCQHHTDKQGSHAEFHSDQQACDLEQSLRVMNIDWRRHGGLENWRKKWTIRETRRVDEHCRVVVYILTHSARQLSSKCIRKFPFYFL
jgi:hypothetical protein